jgi:hypothetical protein
MAEAVGENRRVYPRVRSCRLGSSFEEEARGDVCKRLALEIPDRYPIPSVPKR